MAVNADLKKVLNRVKAAQSQLETLLKDKTWVEEARKYAERQGKEVKKLFSADVTKVKSFLERERKELEKFQKQIPSEVKKLQKFVGAQRKEFQKLLTNVRKAGRNAGGTARKAGAKKRTTAKAAASKDAVNHAPPKKIFGIIGRYAEATYTASSKAGNLDKVEQELAAVGALLAKNKGFAGYLANPTIPRGEKYNRLNAALDESKFSNVSRNLFLTLAANGRIGEADRVLAAFDELVNAAKGNVEATVISADPLSDKVIEQIKKSIQGLSGKGKNVELKAVVDPKILGGLKVLIGDRSIDLTVASRVQTLSVALESQ